MFSLSTRQRRSMRKGTRADRRVIRLLADPDRLLMAVLFWNLLVNVAYFTIGSILTLRLEHEGETTAAAVWAFSSLMAMIVVSEMLPKNFAILQPQFLSRRLVIFLAPMVRLLDPIMPALRIANLFSTRLLCPRFQPESYLHVRDLERAVELAAGDATFVHRQQETLQNIVSFSETRAEEIMRPRLRWRLFHAPVSRDDLAEKIPSCGYVLIARPGEEEPHDAVVLSDLADLPTENLERFAQPLEPVPWSATVAQVFEVLCRQGRRVAAVINEHGETIGILTYDDILDEIFSPSASRTQRVLLQQPIRPIEGGGWQVSGMMSLRRLTRKFGVRRIPSKSVTVAGIVGEILQRLPKPGDSCRWGPFVFRVVEIPARGDMLLEMTLAVEPDGEALEDLPDEKTLEDPDSTDILTDEEGV